MKQKIQLNINYYGDTEDDKNDKIFRSKNEE